MTLVTKDTLTGDPLVSFNFEVIFDGKLTGFFTECSGIGSETEVSEHKIVGKGDQEAIRKIPGRHKWGDITLKRGVTTNDEMWKWREMVIKGDMASARTNGSIKMYDQMGTLIAQWDVVAAWPSKVGGPSMTADSSAIAIEELTIVHEGIQRVQ
jgi:phage tail-like protein